MKAKRKRRGGIPFTAHDARVFQGIFDALDGRYGDETRLYMQQYIRLKAKSIELEKKGLKVRIALPDFPRRPLLIIEKWRGPQRWTLTNFYDC